MNNIHLLAFANGEFWLNTGYTLWWALVGLIILIFGFWGFDLVLRKINFEDELKKGNIAVAIVVAAIIVAMAYIAGVAIA